MTTTKGRLRPTRLAVLTDAIYPVIFLMGIVAVWKILSITLDVAPYVLPSPEKVAEAMVTERSEFLKHSVITFREAMTGLFWATLIGVTLAAAMASWRPAELLLYPPLIASQAVPKIALAPLIVLWLGFGLMPKIVIAAVIAVFPITIGAFVGMMSTEPQLIDMGRSMGWSWFTILRKIKFPTALPSIFGGLKLAGTLSILGAIVGEFVASQEGVGYLLLIYQGRLQTENVFAGLFYLAAMGLLVFVVIDIIEKRVVTWNEPA